MSATAREFASQLELPCTVAYGKRGESKLEGVAVRIESARLVLRIRGAKQTLVRLGEEVRLRVHLPVEPGIAAKDLSIRARIIEVTETHGGARTLVVTFRRAQFRDRDKASAAPRKSASAAVRWEM